MAKSSKRYKEVLKNVNLDQEYDLSGAVEVLQKGPHAKFDESIEINVIMGVDPKKSDQMVRGTVSLPHGTGRKTRVLVLTKGEKLKDAEAAGADFFGGDEYIEKIKGGWTDFESVIVTPDMMREVGKLGKILGPRGLMPTPKAGTVTTDITNAVKQIQAGKIEFKLDKSGVINNAVGKISFNAQQIVENIKELFQAIFRAKPASAKGIYVKGLNLSSTMGAGLKINLREFAS